MHIRLKSTQYIAKAGKKVRMNPGDWVDVGRQIAETWIAADMAEIPGLDKAEALAGDLENAGVVVIGEMKRAKPIRRKYPQLDIKQMDKPQLLWERNLIWLTNKAYLVPVQALAGFAYIASDRPQYSAWEMAVMLFGPEAKDFGSHAERRKTQKVIGDLKIPIFNVFAFWVKNTAVSRRIISAWWKEVEAGANLQHAFLRAIYPNPVKICTLPVGWAGIR
jgi:hypothetical protein